MLSFAGKATLLILNNFTDLSCCDHLHKVGGFFCGKKISLSLQLHLRYLHRNINSCHFLLYILITA